MTITDETTSLIVNQSASKRQLWFAAIKPPMYTVAVIPISFGTAFAYAQTKIFHFEIFVTFLLSAILIIAWLNLSNDVFDSDTGIDVNKAHSVVNLTGNRTLVFWISNICLLLGLGGILLINYWLQNWTLLWLITACCALGYSYQGPPFRLGYLGLGELICFVTFGPMAIAASYYSQTQVFSVSSLWASTIIGISTSIILFCSHFHQVKDDLAAGKKSPIVRLGTKLGSQILIISVILFYGLCFLLTVMKILPYSTLIVMLSMPISYQLINHVNQYHDQPEKVKNSKFIAVNYHFCSGILLCLGLIQ
ncbi:2-carboxy-1,4-naphthoquinone phytyltransferase [Geminocystis sp. GBBB08]|uniref:2-carboxy-1,4-naphthoquinone phytyltransferase n=1 Tax=Geminocystis sp. GBBB08 TaxID=2604140 RepID=UPI0027E2B6D6|nr:2-carboxy-1,4-naphthoquinone phytyltransferase [Geminocystis sp. GBBB08]MBL1209031.1 2-carboxy-1,4-naphthoquinone phytyltransferase [Geminocystis sp. GBBB08]